MIHDGAFIFQALVVCLVLAKSGFAASCAAWDSVTTWRNDPYNSGVYNREFVLTPWNVNASNFGQLFVAKGNKAYGQPLLVPQVDFGSKGIKDALFFADEANNVYAYDANSNYQIWSRYLGPPVPIAYFQGQCDGISPVVGVTSTPVIDCDTGIMYIVASVINSNSEGGVDQVLYAVDIATGWDHYKSVVITASNGQFQGLYHLQRSGLGLCGDNIFIGFASHCDWGEYHGWVFTHNKVGLAQTAYFMTTPTAQKDSYLERGGIWGAGSKFGFLPDCSTFVTTGNGAWNITTGDVGNTLLKLSPPPELRIADYFTPYDWSFLNDIDWDLASGGVTLFNAGGKLLAAVPGKDGNLYILDTSNLGQISDNNTKAWQVLGVRNGEYETMFGCVTVFNNRLLYHGRDDVLKAFQIGSDGKLDPNPVAQTSAAFDYPGAQPIVSANNGQYGIIWEVDPCGKSGCNNNHGRLYAWDASTYKKLYSSDAVAGDDLGGVMSFIFPVIWHGKVYVNSMDGIHVYGLKN